MTNQKWRLPTQAECVVIDRLPESLKAIFKSALNNTDEIFWTSTEHDQNVAFVFDLQHCSVSYSEKFNFNRSRLVRPTTEQPSSTSDRFKISPCGEYLTDFDAQLDWKVNSHPNSSPWPRAMWKFNGTNVLPDFAQDIPSTILAVQNALVGKPEALHFDRLLILFNQKLSERVEITTN
jgi:hypothetical protein